ncbi:MAG: amidohydrolase family protein [Clostridia bacterium]
MRIDAHTHITYPANILYEKMRALNFNKVVVCSAGVARGEKITTFSAAKTMMRKIGLAQNHAQSQTIAEINKELAEVISGYQDLFIGFAKLDLFQENMKMDLARAVDLGLQGIGEIIGIHQNIDKLELVLQVAHEAELPVFIHCDYPVDSNDLTSLFKIIPKYTQAKIIIGHLGGDYWLEVIEQAKKISNVYVDTSEVVNQIALQVAVNTLPERVLYASDFPWDAPEAMLTRINCLKNNDGVKAQVLGLNFLRILKGEKLVR